MQTPAAVSPARSPAPRPVQLVIVRANGPLFYSVAAAALLEESVVASAQRMLQLFAGHGELCAWLRSE